MSMYKNAIQYEVVKRNFKWSPTTWCASLCGKGKNPTQTANCKRLKFRRFGMHLPQLSFVVMFKYSKNSDLMTTEIKMEELLTQHIGFDSISYL